MSMIDAPDFDWTDPQACQRRGARERRRSLRQAAQERYRARKDARRAEREARTCTPANAGNWRGD